MKYQISSLTAALLFACSPFVHAQIGNYSIPDSLNVGGLPFTEVFQPSTHGVEGWTGIDDTFEGSATIAYTYTPKKTGDQNFSQYWSYLILRDTEVDGSIVFRIGTDHGNPPGSDVFIAPVAGAVLLDDGEPVVFEERSYDIVLDFVYAAGGPDSATVTIDGVSFGLPDGNYGFELIQLVAAHDGGGPGADFTNMTITVIPEPATMAFIFGTLGFGLVLLLKRRRGDA